MNLSGNVEQYSLQLSPGLYEFYMQASTEAGIGVKGPSTTAHIGDEERHPLKHKTSFNLFCLNSLPFCLFF